MVAKIPNLVPLLIRLLAVAMVSPTISRSLEDQSLEFTSRSHKTGVHAARCSVTENPALNAPYNNSTRMSRRRQLGFGLAEVTLLADIASTYVQIRTLETRLEFVGQNIAWQQKIAAIMRQLHELGDPRPERRYEQPRRYHVDQIAFITITKVQQQDLQAQAHGAIALGLIQVYRALGGGWETCAIASEPEWGEPEWGEPEWAEPELAEPLPPQPEPLPAIAD